MLVINCEFYDAEIDMTILKSVYLDIENGCVKRSGTNDWAARCEPPVLDPEAHASDAASKSHYHLSQRQGSHPAQSILSPRDDLLTLAQPKPGAGGRSAMGARRQRSGHVSRWPDGHRPVGACTPGQVERLPPSPGSGRRRQKPLSKNAGHVPCGLAEHSGLYTALGMI